MYSLQPILSPFPSFYAAYIVYIDWILGTPCLLYNLATLIHSPTATIVQLMTYDIMMIGTGFVAAVSCQSAGWRYCWYIISSVFFAGIGYTLRVQSQEVFELLGKEFKQIGRLYKQLLTLFVVCWCIYPILFIVGHNGSVVTGDSTGFLEIITVPLEIVAKGVSGIVVRVYAFHCLFYFSRQPELPNRLCFSLNFLCPSHSLPVLCADFHDVCAHRKDQEGDCGRRLCGRAALGIRFCLGFRL